MGTELAEGRLRNLASSAQGGLLIVDSILLGTASCIVTS